MRRLTDGEATWYGVRHNKIECWIAHTFGGMRVERALRVMKLILMAIVLSAQLIPRTRLAAAQSSAHRRTSVSCFDEMWKGELRMECNLKFWSSIPKASFYVTLAPYGLAGRPQSKQRHRSSSHFTITTGVKHTMSLLRPSIAGRMLRISASSARRAVPGTVRFDSQTALGTPLTTSESSSGASVTKAGEWKDVQVRHNQPDYAAEVDQASSWDCLSIAPWVELIILGPSPQSQSVWWTEVRKEMFCQLLFYLELQLSLKRELSGTVHQIWRGLHYSDK